MRLSNRKSFTAKDARDAKEHRGEKNRYGKMPCQTVRSHGTRLCPASLLTFLRVPGVLCGERLLNLTPHLAASTHGEF
jgi:hypothetical protein